MVSRASCCGPLARGLSRDRPGGVGTWSASRGAVVGPGLAEGPFPSAAGRVSAWAVIVRACSGWTGAVWPRLLAGRASRGARASVACAEGVVAGCSREGLSVPMDRPSLGGGMVGPDVSVPVWASALAVRSSGSAAACREGLGPGAAAFFGRPSSAVVAKDGPGGADGVFVTDGEASARGGLIPSFCGAGDGERGAGATARSCGGPMGAASRAAGSGQSGAVGRAGACSGCRGR